MQFCPEAHWPFESLSVVFSSMMKSDQTFNTFSHSSDRLMPCKLECSVLHTVLLESREHPVSCSSYKITKNIYVHTSTYLLQDWIKVPEIATCTVNVILVRTSSTHLKIHGEAQGSSLALSDSPGSRCHKTMTDYRTCIYRHE